MGLWGFGKKALNSTIGPDCKPLDTLFSERIEPISDRLMIQKFTKAIIASGSFIIPKDGTYKITACGAGGTTIGNGLSGRGGGGCAIDQRSYSAGDILTLTVSGVASGVCAARDLSMTANGTTTSSGATAIGGNVANHTGGTSSPTASIRNSLGCGAAGYSETERNGGNGGILGGEGWYWGYNHTPGNGGDGGIVGGKGGTGGNGSYPPGLGGSGMFGGSGGNSATTSGVSGGAGGSGTLVGGRGGNALVTSSVGGAGGTGGILGGTGGTGTSYGGKGGDIPFLKGEAATTTAGGSGAFAGMYWAIPFKEVLDWTFGNAIIFIEEV